MEMRALSVRQSPTRFFPIPLSNIDGIELAADPEGSLIGRTDVSKVGSRLHSGSRPLRTPLAPFKGTISEVPG